ncbi:ExbD/TolR family protein [Rhodalgimonas zhirmunskyi]|uniref:Biopolymer transporter ExbD n=1 Tax=Rhodalgimonas zhirmunskyi TaxID=2964767 RepID=A0AAJ1X4D2_9RHOB|nr:biopolymer transporter ExbD [Rhodoalgimonas zhirmunskyi]MDQ2093381.1 biopolymer transporter ExbD [Rhodoalgimonas zhirmunskyi]
MQLGPPIKRRKPSLTPMIDVVFLLLVFFMLASRFGQDVVIDLPIGSGAAETPYAGPPRLVEVRPEEIRLNGVPVGEEALADALAPLTEKPGDTIILRPAGGADLQRIVTLMEQLNGAGYTSLVLVGSAAEQGEGGQ